MKKNEIWTKEMVNNFVTDNDGDALALMMYFPFTQDNLFKIGDAFADTKKYTDSDLCDLILSLALSQVG